MIIKQRSDKPAVNKMQRSGAKVEKDVAFYLNREFSDSDKVFVFNGLRIEHKGEAAQIDHLILYRHGFVLIESKSIKGKVRVNRHLEWQRTYNNQWIGMPSPIAQATLQKDLLKAFLNHHAELLLDKLIFIGLQTYFGGRAWDIVCASSNETLIERDQIPSKVSEQLVKAEQVVGKVNKIVSSHRGILSTTPTFSKNELTKLKAFLLDCHTPLAASKEKIATKPDLVAKSETSIIQINECTSEYLTRLHTQEIQSPSVINDSTTVTPLKEKFNWFRCKSCGEEETEAKYGKFGYYVHCNKCNSNTSMKQACPVCRSKKTRVNKSKQVYTLSCDCGHRQEFTRE